MFGGIIASALGAGGKKPEVPTPANVDVSKETGAAYADIAKNLPALQDIAASINASNTDQLLRSWRTMLPGFGRARKDAMGNISSLLNGEIPADVMSNIQRAAASAALKGGTSGSTFGYNFTPQSIGTTSLALQQQGLSNFMGLSQMLKPQTYDYTGLFVTPQQRIAVQQWNEANRFNTESQRNQIAAMPSPLQNAIMSFANNFDQLAWSTAGAFTGGAVGNMLGGGGSHGMPSWNYPSSSGAPSGSFYNPWMDQSFQG